MALDIRLGDWTLTALVLVSLPSCGTKCEHLTRAQLVVARMPCRVFSANGRNCSGFLLTILWSPGTRSS